MSVSVIVRSFASVIVTVLDLQFLDSRTRVQDVIESQFLLMGHCSGMCFMPSFALSDRRVFVGNTSLPATKPASAIAKRGPK